MIAAEYLHRRWRRQPQLFARRLLHASLVPVVQGATCVIQWQLCHGWRGSDFVIGKYCSLGRYCTTGTFTKRNSEVVRAKARYHPVTIGDGACAPRERQRSQLPCFTQGQNLYPVGVHISGRTRLWLFCCPVANRLHFCASFCCSRSREILHSWWRL